MTIEQAIKILQDTESTYQHRDWEDYIDAVKLGIEALERVQFNQTSRGAILIGLLPGETKE